VPDNLVWLTWSGIFLLPWGLLYIGFPRHRNVMRWASVFTAPFGLTEPIFVPEYWSPPSLFNLARRTGFDLESVVFSFGIGGVAAVLYSILAGTRLKAVDELSKHVPRHRYHKWALAVPFLGFPVLYAFPWNPIYPAVTAMVLGAVATGLCRPDLKRKTWVGGVLFLAYYWVFVEGLELLSPGYVEQVWNLPDLTGVLVLNSPLEELLFAFAFGMYWSGVYEHFTWRHPVPGRPGVHHVEDPGKRKGGIG